MESGSAKAPSGTGDARPKESKKDRHMKYLSDLSRFLERTNEAAVQEVLLFKREIRETLETYDDNLEKYCSSIDEAGYLIDKTEDDVNDMLTKLKSKLNNRAQMIEKLATDLDQTELKRVETVGTEFKRLVDVLVAIGYQLPDDIERTISNEAFDVNQEVIANRVAYAKTVGELKITHIKLEAALVARWEATRAKWRHLRHDKALADFRSDIRSDPFNDPTDRKQFMKRFRQGQKERREQVTKHIGVLLAQNFGTITSTTIADLQQSFTTCGEGEAMAIQACYNGLTELRESADFRAKERVEAIRKELHLFGALQVDPKLHLYADQLEPAIEDEALAELWRLGGGLKPDVQALLGELRCEEIVYDRVVQSMLDKVEFVMASFPLKGILEERGRLSQLDKVRGLITKMRSAPRAEIAGVLKALVPELEDISHMEQLAGTFADTLKEICVEANAELDAYEAKLQALTSLPPSALGSTAVLPAGTKTLDSTALGKTTAGKTTKSGTLGATKGKKSEREGGPAVYVDPLLIKGWHRKLGALFYGTDLPEAYQRLLADIVDKVRVQRECNALVDEVVRQDSEELLRRMDQRYRKLVDKVVTFLETQATLVSTQTTNLCSFYSNLAKVIEMHRAEQKRLDDKSAEELWDIKEDFRLQLEDREAEYQAACQRIREATKDADVAHHFQEVIEVLEKIQQTYRAYHQQACFAADKYPLWLIDEFRGCLVKLCSIMFMQPRADHPVLTEYDRIFDTVERLNAAFFEGNELAGGVQRSDHPPLDVDAVVEDYASPYASIPPESALAYVGKYAVLAAIPTVCANFSVDSFFVTKGSHAPDEESGSAGDDSLKALAASKHVPHAQCPWMKAAAIALPVEPEALEQMDADDRVDYEANLAKHFVVLVDDLPPPDAAPVAVLPGKKGAAASAAPVVPAVSVLTPGVFPNLSHLSLDDRAKYARDKELVDRIKTRLEEEASAEFILRHVPRDAMDQPWVAELQVTGEEIAQMYKNIRHTIIASLESESFKKMVGTERRMETIKTEFTDQLEDRIRNHWPRRGRVETEIKQPREKELLGHKDKTYRLIVAIQDKMVELQARYTGYWDASRAACDAYVNEMTTLRNSLNGNFKNLASLQGLDVRARGTTLDFQADSAQRVQQLGRMSTTDVDAIVAYARDFRRICPLQKPGVEGGYSEQELQEIEVLMEAQCADMAVVKAQWAQEIHQLAEQQAQSMLCQDEFNTKYAKCTQEVAMAEGLGQKYGAPRRRAQERIRTEVSRDERAAGKVDELVALVEFVCSEMHAHEALRAVDRQKAQESNQSPSSSQKTRTQVRAKGADLTVTQPGVPSSTVSRGIEGANRMQYTWQLMQTLRTALIARAKFLDVLADKSFSEAAAAPLQWLDGDRLNAAVRNIFGDDASALVTDHAVPSLEDSVIPGQPAPMATIHAVYEDVSAACRKETKQLYESEGKGPTIPESLELWLSEAKEKLVGRHGYQERAWKRLWAQAFRLDQVLCRFKALEDGDAPGTDPATANPAGAAVTLPPPPQAPAPAVKGSVQSTCLLSLTVAHMAMSKKMWKAAAKQFSELLVVWEQGRDKHERLLKPRLGSPDKADELAALDKLEMERSQEMQRGVAAFRCSLVRGQAQRFRVFCEDLGSAGKGLVLMLDSCLRQELLAVPPDTAVPKKHLTLKKLRKAQRIREEVSKGKEDTSLRRLWAGIELSEHQVLAVTSAEDLVPDLGALPEDATGFSGPDPALAEAAPAPTGKGAKEDKKSKDKKADKGAAPPPSKPSLLPASWLERIKEMSAVQGLVSSAHRTVIQHRDEGLDKYLSYLQQLLLAVREDYGLMLQQEQSWTQRWQRQVDMLRQGKL